MKCIHTIDVVNKYKNVIMLDIKLSHLREINVIDSRFIQNIIIEVYL